MADVDGPVDAAWFRRMADGSNLVFFILRLQPDLAFEFINNATQTQLGVAPADCLADAALLLSRIDLAHTDRLAQALALPPGDEAVVELTWRHLDGHPVYSRFWLHSRQRSDGSVVLEGTGRDISQLHEAEVSLQLSEDRYRLMAQNAWDVIWRMATDTTVTYVSPSVERVRGFTPEEAMRQPLREALTPHSWAMAQTYFQQLSEAILERTTPPVLQGEAQFYRKDGSILDAELQVIPYVDADGRVTELIGVSRDISDRKAFEAELTRLAITDALTNVWNRRHGEALMAADVAQASRTRVTLSMLMLDLDHFKAVNDTYGHQTGDHVLRTVARNLVDTVHSTDVVARWGGEEFAIMLRHCAIDQATVTAEKLRARISEHHVGEVGAVTASIGVAELRADEDFASLLARADRALYEAKRAGRNRVHPDVRDHPDNRVHRG